MTPDRVTALAFSGRLRDAERALASAEPTDEIALIRAYVDTARGRFKGAEAQCRALLGEASDPSVRSRAGITLGSVLRQTARHREASVIDAAALRVATTRSLKAHALIGLAADAVGMLDARACGRRLAEAARTAPPRDWRCMVRLEWVRAERALLTGDAPAAIASSRAALARARRAGALRHEAKSLLFLGAALRDAGDDGAVVRLEEARRIAHDIGARPIAAVARGLLSTMRQ